MLLGVLWSNKDQYLGMTGYTMESSPRGSTLWTPLLNTFIEIMEGSHLASTVATEAFCLQEISFLGKGNIQSLDVSDLGIFSAGPTMI